MLYIMQLLKKMHYYIRLVDKTELFYQGNLEAADEFFEMSKRLANEHRELNNYPAFEFEMYSKQH